MNVMFSGLWHVSPGMFGPCKSTKTFWINKRKTQKMQKQAKILGR